MNLRIFLIIFATVSLWFLMMIWWSSYQYYVMIHADDPVVPSLTVVEWRATIIRWDIAIDLVASESYDLEENDAVETGPESLATVTWPDRSLTRLGESTRIVIHRMVAAAWYEDIEISFSLKKWKIWSNVVRALIGESYFETRLPKNNIVAWVRGTIYEINLDNRYIHSVNHAIALSDSSGKNMYLLPWELVDSENIWIKRGQEIIDTTWANLNKIKDADYIEERIRSLSISLDDNANILNKSYDALIRWILSHFDGFEILTLQSLLDRWDTLNLSKYSIDTLTPYYQRIRWLTDTGSLDTLKLTLYTISSGTTVDMRQIRNMLEINTIWDSLDNGDILPGAKKILEQSTLNLDTISLENLTDILTKKDLQEEIKNLFEKVLE